MFVTLADAFATSIACKPAPQTFSLKKLRDPSGLPLSAKIQPTEPALQLLIPGTRSILFDALSHAVLQHGNIRSCLTPALFWGPSQRYVYFPSGLHARSRFPTHGRKTAFQCVNSLCNQRSSAVRHCGARWEQAESLP